MTTACPVPRIVVGLDDSGTARSALRWALRTATARGAEVHAVHVLPPAPLLPATSLALLPHGRRPVQDPAEWTTRMRDVVAASCQDLADPPQVKLRTVTGDVARELATAASGAELLVLGGPGEHSMENAPFGATATHCLRVAHCPAVLINSRAASAES